MAAVLQHQIVGKVNDLNQKLTAHARIIFQLSVELDKIKSENEELKKILKGHKIVIKQLRDGAHSSGSEKSGMESEPLENDDDITLKQEYQMNETINLEQLE